MILLDSVVKMGKNYFPQVFLKDVNVVEENKTNETLLRDSTDGTVYVLYSVRVR